MTDINNLAPEDYVTGFSTPFFGQQDDGGSNVDFNNKFPSADYMITKFYAIHKNDNNWKGLTFLLYFEGAPYAKILSGNLAPTDIVRIQMNTGNADWGTAEYQANIKWQADPFYALAAFNFSNNPGNWHLNMQSIGSVDVRKGATTSDDIVWKDLGVADYTGGTHTEYVENTFVTGLQAHIVNHQNWGVRAMSLYHRGIPYFVNTYLDPIKCCTAQYTTQPIYQDVCRAVGDNDEWKTNNSKCFSTLRNYCVGDNLYKPECQTYCKDPNIDCDAALTALGTSTLKSIGIKALIADDQKNSTLPCFLGSSFYQQMYSDLMKGLPPSAQLTAQSARPECFYTPCGTSLIKPLSVKQSTGNTCPNIVSCISISDVSNAGNINGPINISHDTKCGQYSNAAPVTTPPVTTPTNNPSSTPSSSTPSTTPPIAITTTTSSSSIIIGFIVLIFIALIGLVVWYTTRPKQFVQKRVFTPNMYTNRNMYINPNQGLQQPNQGFQQPNQGLKQQPVVNLGQNIYPGSSPGLPAGARPV